MCVCVSRIKTHFFFGHITLPRVQQHNQWTLSFPCHFPRTKVQRPTTVTNINIRNKMNIKPPSLLLAIYIGVTSQGRRRTHGNLRKNILLRNYKNNINLNYNFSHFVHVRAGRTSLPPRPQKKKMQLFQPSGHQHFMQMKFLLYK